MEKNYFVIMEIVSLISPCKSPGYWCKCHSRVFQQAHQSWAWDTCSLLTPFILLKSKQNLSVRSFLGTRMIRPLHSREEGTITPISFNMSSSFFSSGNRHSGTYYKGCCRGIWSFKEMWWHTTSVFPGVCRKRSGARSPESPSSFHLTGESSTAGSLPSSRSKLRHWISGGVHAPPHSMNKKGLGHFFSMLMWKVWSCV